MVMRHAQLLVLFALCPPARAAAPAPAEAALARLAPDYWEAGMRLDPLSATFVHFPRYHDRLPDTRSGLPRQTVFTVTRAFKYSPRRYGDLSVQLCISCDRSAAFVIHDHVRREGRLEIKDTIKRDRLTESEA